MGFQTERLKPPAAPQAVASSGLALQRKISVGTVDDPLEHEADRVAGWVMGSSGPRHAAPGGEGAASPPCPCGGDGGSCTCRDEDKVVHRTALDPAPALAPPIVNEVLASPGDRLEPSARRFFETRMGWDFGNVRIHADERAGVSARLVDATAYAAGPHIAFAPGHYSPGTTQGRRLLAHELTHVVQQARTLPVLRRVPPTPQALPPTMPTPGAGDFRIERVQTSGNRQIFFARNSSTLTADAVVEIGRIKAANKAATLVNVRLVGFASADEAATLGQARADAVKKALTDPPDPVTVTSATAASASLETAAFSGARTVDVVVAAAPPKQVDCKAKVGGKLVNPPKQACPAMDPLTWTAFNQAWPIAKDAMAKAVTAVAGTPGPDDAALIDKFFTNHDPPTLAALRINLGKLKSHVDGLDKITSCGGQCDTGGCDAESTIAYNSDVDAASRMTLCVPNFKSNNTNDRARNLIHESAHGTTPLGGPAAAGEGTKDVAYRHERMLFQLSPADQLRNSDSYALFCLFLREAKVTSTPGATPAGIKTPATDTFAGVPAANQPALRLALAKLEKRLMWAADHVGQMYGELVKVQKGAAWPTWAKDLMTEAAKRFPLTAPPGAPTPADQTRVAAIVDRYVRMKAGVKANLTVSQTAAGVAKWGPPGSDWTAPATLVVGPALFTATPEDQVSLLLEALARSTRDVESAFIPAYVSYAAWIHSQNP
jgi:outer membrane protein OmpA-like peptidoglycan-associated protein